MHLLRLSCFVVCLSSLAHCEQDPLLVGAFNVQIFGQSKIGKPEVVDVLVKVLARYDLVLVQEIRDSKETAFESLVDKINSAYDDKYEFVTGQRVGRSSSKEQYGFIYRLDKLEVRSMYERDDPYDVFEREPLVVRFRRIGNLGKLQEFTFVSMHAKPSDAVAEMNNLVDVYEESTSYYGPDAVIAGDMNADCSYVCKSCWDEVKLRSDSRFNWLIGDDADTTVSKTDCAYDRIILAGEAMQQNSCCAEVFRFDLQYNLTEDLAAQVSDHYPVEFTIY